MLKAVEHLREELAAVNVMIAELEKEYTEDELAMHIAKLHEYNEIKDVAQDLLGRLGAFDLAFRVPHSHTSIVVAQAEQTTTRSLYPKFNLELDD